MGRQVPTAGALASARLAPTLARAHTFRMVRWVRGISLVLIGFGAVGLHACQTGCEKEKIDRAVAFLEAHQSCQADADCVVISDFCEELPGGSCGQLTMNKQGADSAEWQSLEQELKDCAPDKCTVCLAALIPRCSNGSCGGP